MNVTTQFKTYKKCKLYTSEYMANKSLYIGITTFEDEYPEPLADLTVCLPNERTPKANEAYVDTNNCPWAMDFIEEYGLGKDTGMFGFNGYCIYPLVAFNMDKVKEMSE